MWHSSFHSLSLLGITPLLGFYNRAAFQFEGWYQVPILWHCIIYGQSNLQSSSSSHDPHLCLKSSSEGVGSCRGPYHAFKVCCGFWALEIPSEGREQQFCLWSATSPFHSTHVSEYSFVIVIFLVTQIIMAWGRWGAEFPQSCIKWTPALPKHS